MNDAAHELTDHSQGGSDDAGALDRAERAEAMYRSLVESLPGVTYSESPGDSGSLSISPQIEDLLGYTQDEWIGDPHLWEEVLHPDDRDWVVASCHEANATASSWMAEYRVITRDGRVIWVRDRATLVRGSDGNPLCWQGVMVDITDLKDGAP
jgi:PAS domain S-box-containing protein